MKTTNVSDEINQYSTDSKIKYGYIRESARVAVR